jgi:hypothetical protein
MVRDIKEIIESYETTRVSFRDFTRVGDLNNKLALIEFEGRFADIKADLRYWKSKYTGEWTRRDDKSATAIKFRIAVAIVNNEYKGADGNPLFEKCSITNAEKYASGSPEYRDFVQSRAFYRESLTNISELREDCGTFIMEIKDRLK